MGDGAAVPASQPARVGVLGGFADGVLEGGVQRILRENQTVLRLGSIRRFELQRSLWRLYLGCRRVGLRFGRSRVDLRQRRARQFLQRLLRLRWRRRLWFGGRDFPQQARVQMHLWRRRRGVQRDRKSTRLNSSHGYISYAVFCLKKKKYIHSILWKDLFSAIFSRFQSRKSYFQF